jgi:uncharacterized protein with NAD-binding domain and iron-sulfur cluster
MQMKSEEKKPTEVIIVGGGPAGLAAALRLAQRGARITIVEATDRLGGKAGADIKNGKYDDHGYHIFATWYLNIWRIVDELKLGDRFLDCTEFHYLRRGEFPKFNTYRNPTSWRYFGYNIRSGILSWPEAFLFIYATLDLMAQPYRERSKLDEITITGFLRSRFYRTERVASQFEHLIMKGISVPANVVSAMTMRNVVGYFCKYSEPLFRILNTNLQQGWIEPIRDELVRLGCTIEFNQTLVDLDVDNGSVQTLHFANTQTGATSARKCDRVLLAIPVDRLDPILGDKMYQAAPDLARVRYLETRPMAALDIYFRSHIPKLPKEHIALVDSSFGTSFVDVSRIWGGYEGTVINLIASDTVPLSGLSDDLAIKALIDDLRRSIPFEDEDIERFVYASHKRQPLFLNDAGAWPNRPTARTQVQNLYVAGDYCRSEIDLMCMEGAVTTGLHAAEAIRVDAKLDKHIEILKPATYPRWLFLLAVVLLLPAAALTKLLLVLKPEWKSAPGQRFSDTSPPASDVYTGPRRQ